MLHAMERGKESPQHTNCCFNPFFGFTGRLGGVSGRSCWRHCEKCVFRQGWFVVCCLMVGRLLDVWVRTKLRYRDRDKNESNGLRTSRQWKELKLAKNKW
jgi:hypothetical protein